MSELATVGHDVRKAVADGYPVQRAIATDLYPGATFRQ